MGNCRGTGWVTYIQGVHEGRFSQGRLVPAIRTQGLLNVFEASVAIAAMDSGPSVEFCVVGYMGAGQIPAANAQLVKREGTDLVR